MYIHPIKNNNNFSHRVIYYDLKRTGIGKTMRKKYE